MQGLGRGGHPSNWELNAHMSLNSDLFLGWFFLASIADEHSEVVYTTLIFCMSRFFVSSPHDRALYKIDSFIVQWDLTSSELVIFDEKTESDNDDRELLVLLAWLSELRVAARKFTKQDKRFQARSFRWGSSVRSSNTDDSTISIVYILFCTSECPNKVYWQQIHTFSTVLT